MKNQLIKIFIASAIFTRFLFWIGGIDIFERSVNAGMALAFSVLFAAAIVVYCKEELGDKQ